MNKEMQYFQILVCFGVLFLGIVTSLEVKYIEGVRHPGTNYDDSTVLPASWLTAKSAVYDGFDGIYFVTSLPNWERPNTCLILLFNITSESLSEVTRLYRPLEDKNVDKFGSLVISDGSLYYFTDFSKVLKYDIHSNTSAEIQIPFKIKSGVTFLRNPNEILHFGQSRVNGIPYPIISLDLTTNQTSIVGKLPIFAGTPGGGLKISDDLYFQNVWMSGPAMMRVHLTNLSTTVSKYDRTFPVFDRATATVAVGDDIYLVGGGWKPEEAPGNGIWKMNPVSRTAVFLPVENYPTDANSRGNFYYNPIPIYVEKLRRIYFMGGRNMSSQNAVDDRIWFVDLEHVPQGKTIFNESGFKKRKEDIPVISSIQNQTREVVFSKSSTRSDLMATGVKSVWWLLSYLFYF